MSAATGTPAGTPGARTLLTVTLPSGTVAVARGTAFGLPVFGWNEVPLELLTVRQLADIRLRPARRSDPVALLVWGHRSRRDGKPARWARLYDVAQAAEKKPLTAARQRAVEAALAARRVCQVCGPVDHYTRFGLCAACYRVVGPDHHPRQQR